MLCLGIDLAAQAKATAICATRWTDRKVEVLDLRCGVEDEDLIDLMLAADKVGLDAPLGWPDDFVDAIERHHQGGGSQQLPERRLLTLRETDRRLQDETGRRPLSVSTDLIGVVALRAADLQARLEARGHRIDRSGGGLIAEVYPAAALESWDIDPAGYKGSSGNQRLGEILEALEEGLGGVEMSGEASSEMKRDHNQLDAFISALAARATALGATTGPDSGMTGQASREGWIHVPSVDLGALTAAS